MSQTSRIARMTAAAVRGFKRFLSALDILADTLFRWIEICGEAARFRTARFLRSFPRSPSRFWESSWQHYAATLGWGLTWFPVAIILQAVELNVDEQGDLRVPGNVFALLIVVIVSVLLAMRRLVGGICRVTGKQAATHDPWRADRYGVAALALFIAPTLFLGILWPHAAGLENAQIPITVLTTLFAVAVFSDWASRPFSLSKTLRDQPTDLARPHGKRNLPRYAARTPKQGIISTPGAFSRTVNPRH